MLSGPKNAASLLWLIAAQPLLLAQEIRSPAPSSVEIGANDFRISDMGGLGNTTHSVLDPSVAYNSTDNEYLVVWAGTDNLGGLLSGEFEIFGQRIDALTGLEVGANDFRISDMGGTGNTTYQAYHPVAAYNSTDNQFLVVWYGDDNVSGLVDNEDEIFGQLLDAAGGALGANDFRISDMGGTGVSTYLARDPAVAYNSVDNEYLVVWEGDDNTGGLVNNELEIFAQRLEADTGLELGGDVRLSDLGGTGSSTFKARFPDVAYNATDNEFLVVWIGDDDSGGLVNDEFEIFGQRVDGTNGAEVGFNDFRISDMGGNGHANNHGPAPAVAYAAAGEYLVVWTGEDQTGGMIAGEYEVFGQRIDATTGAELGVNDFRISDLGGTGIFGFNPFESGVAYVAADEEYLVTFGGSDDVGGLVISEIEIFSQRITAATGNEVGPNDARLSDAGGTGSTTYSASQPELAVGPGNSSLIVWRGSDDVGGTVDGEFEVHGQRVAGPNIFLDGFESGNTTAWSQTAP